VIKFILYNLKIIIQECFFVSFQWYPCLRHVNILYIIAKYFLCKMCYLPLSTNLIFDFAIVPTVWFIFVFFIKANEQIVKTKDYKNTYVCTCNNWRYVCACKYIEYTLQHQHTYAQIMEKTA
jgi:hypothetical protein